MTTTINILSDTDAFYHELCFYLSAVKICYGGSGITSFFLRHPDIKKWLKAKIRDNTLDIENSFSIIVNEQYIISLESVMEIIADTTPLLDTTSLTTTLTTSAFADIIEAVLPIVAVAVIIGFLCWAVRWAIRLFRGV